MEARAQQLAQALDTSEIGLVDGAGRFHFDAYVLSAPLHDDVNLVTVLIAQVVKRDAFRVSGGLLRYFTEDKGLQQLAEEHTLIVQLGCAAAQQSARQAGIAEVQLRGFDQPLSAIAEPWRQELHQEQTIHQCKVAADSGAAELECARQLAEVGKSSGLARGKCEKLRQRIEVGDVSQLVHVPLDECFYVIRVPVIASLRCALLDNGVAAADDALRYLLAESSAGRKDLPVAEECIQKCCGSAFQLDLRQRVEPQDLNATGQRVRETRDEQHIRRAGENEAHGGADRVDRWFKSRKQLRHTLELGEN